MTRRLPLLPGLLPAPGLMPGGSSRGQEQLLPLLCATLPLALPASEGLQTLMPLHALLLSLEGGANPQGCACNQVPTAASSSPAAVPLVPLGAPPGGCVSPSGLMNTALPALGAGERDRMGMGARWG